jgi:hypothetical protein
MISILDDKYPIDIKETTCHSGGAKGADTYWENYTIRKGGKVKAYSYQTDYHNSPNKVEISEEDYQEGIQEIKFAKKLMSRNSNKYMNLLARNWAQVKYSNQILAIGHLIRPGEYNSKGYKNKANITVVDGGTGYAVAMGILHKKPVYVFDQEEDKWYFWNYIKTEFSLARNVFIYEKDFAGIGTRNINANGIKAIKNILKIYK